MEKESFLDLEWQDLAKCRTLETNVFYPEDGFGVQAAQRICAECIVIDECLDYALLNHEVHGVWGGKSEKERRRIIRDLPINL